MNFQNLEYFMAVAKEKNITRAAESLGMSQQALSNHISRLEEELGCDLFERRHGLELTYAGKCFKDSAERILDIQEQTVQALDDISNNLRGELRVGIAFTRGCAILPLVFPEYHKTHPMVSLSITEDVSVDLEEALNDGSVDVIIGYTPFKYDNIASVNLMKEHVYLVVPKIILRDIFGENYRSAVELFNTKPDITLFKNCQFILLKKGERIRDIAAGEFKLHGISPEISIETENIQTSFALAAEGLGIAIVPELYVTSPYLISGSSGSHLRDNVELLRFSDNDARNTLNIAVGYNENRYQSHAVRDFILLCEKKFRQIK